MLLCGVFVSSFASVWNPEFSAQLDLDDRQGFIASSAMQQKKNQAQTKGGYKWSDSCSSILNFKALWQKFKLSKSLGAGSQN